MSQTTIAYAATQDAQLPEGDGKKILQAACTACHGLDEVMGLRLDKAGWEGSISEMVSNGAQVDQKDYPVLVDYLVKNFGPAGAKPAGQSSDDGAAKKILNDVCTTCHDLDLVSGQHLSKDEWQSIVNSMVAKGAGLTDKDTPVLVDYLAKTYGPEK